MVREAPLRERRWALLARAQYQAGQQAEALRTIHQLKAVLSQQLGHRPEPGGRGAGAGASSGRMPR